MLSLRRAVVVATGPLTVEVEGEHRLAWADASLLGPVEEGDEVIVNTAALDLGLGSGGFDIVHVNLTRGLDAPVGHANVMKLNYTSLQHAVEPVEAGEGALDARPPLLALMLHGQLAPAVWAASRRQPGLRLGYVQAAGGALPGGLSDTVAELRGRGLLCGHVTAGPAFGGEHEAIGLVGGIHAAAARLGWQAIVAGPGPGIAGSGTAYGHGGMAALDSLHAALALGLPAMLAPRISGGDPRPRHRGVSHHTRAVLGLVLRPVEVAMPAGIRCPHELAEAIQAGGHRAVAAAGDLEGYAASGLAAETMGRSIEEEPEFFAAALAAGEALALAVTGD